MNTDDDKTLSKLAAAAQQGDEASYKRLLSRCLPHIKKALSGRLANPGWVDDVTQTVLMSVHKSLESYDPDRPFKPWLNAIISFRRTDFLRKYYRKRRNRQTSLENPKFIKNHVTFPHRAGELKDIEAALDVLSDKQAEVFRLVRIHGLTSREAAKRMDMSVSAVKVSVHRSTKKIKKMLK